MVARHQVEQFTVAAPEDLEDLEACLVEERVESAVVEIPEGSAALLTAREFRRVVNLARDRGIQIAFSTEDPLRRELIRIVGGDLTGEIRVQHAVDAHAATRKLSDDVTQAAPATNGAKPYRPWQSPATRPPLESLDVEYDRSNPSFSFVVNPPTRSRRALPETEPSFTDPLVEVWDGYTPPDPVFHRSQRAEPKPRRRTRARWRVVASLMLVAVVLASSLLTAIVVLPSATIQLTPATYAIDASVTYGVALDNNAFDLVIQPESVNVVLTFEGAAPATGTRLEPDGVARGTLLLTNTATVDIVVPAGTVFATDSGLTFASSEEVVVPAADPFGALTVGSATVAVVAESAGPDGNISADSLRGQLESGVYFSNRDAFSGGTMREITVVTADDIAALRQRAEDDLNQRAATAFESRLAQDQTLLDGARERAAIQYTFDHQPGEDAQIVQAQATLALSALAYRLGDIHEQARAEVSRRVAAAIQPGTELIPASISIGDPQPLAGTNGLGFTVSASAATRAVIDRDDIGQLEADLVGLTPASANERIAQVPGVESASVRYDRDWFGERMPRLQSRISIEVVDATGIPTQTTTAGP